MEVKVSLNNLRTAPRKVRQVADLVRNKNVAKARSLLEATPQKTSIMLLKLLKSAVASANNAFKLQADRLFIARIFVDEGPKLKRWHPMSRGRAYPIMKRTSHITLVISDGNKENDLKTDDKKEKIIKKVKDKKEEVVKVSSVKKTVKKTKKK